MYAKHTIRNRKHPGTYPEPIGPDHCTEYTGLIVCPKCQRTTREWCSVFTPDATHAEDNPAGELVPWCHECAGIDGDTITEDPEENPFLTHWPKNEDNDPEFCGCDRLGCPNPTPMEPTCHECGGTDPDMVTYERPGSWGGPEHLCNHCAAYHEFAAGLEDVPAPSGSTPGAGAPSVVPESASWSDQVERKLLALDDLAERIDAKEAELEALRSQRVNMARDLIRLDGITGAEVAGRLGISTRRVWKMIEDTKTPTPDSTEPLFTEEG